MVIKKSLLTWLLIVAFALEAIAVTNYKIRFFNYPLMGYNSFLFILSGIAIALLPFFSRPDNQSFTVHTVKRRWLNAGLYFSFFIAVCVFSVMECAKDLQAMPIDYHNADMIPQIKVCCERLIQGQKVYEPIQEIWDGLKPTYLPFMWLAYLPAEFFGKDVRWTSLIAMLLGLGLYTLLLFKEKSVKSIYILAAFIVIGFLFWFLLIKDSSFFPWTEEGVVIGYYLFLGYAVIKKNPVLIGIACSLCFLSRYVLLFWIPVYFVYLFFFESRKKSMVAAALFTLIVLLVFVFPFFINQPDYFISILGKSYRDLAKNSWINSPDTINRSVGLLRFFHVEQINFIHQLLIALSLLVPVSCFILFARFKKYALINKDYFALSSLKLTMVFFYCFVEIPFSYLFFVPVFFSLSIIFMSIKGVQ